MEGKSRLSILCLGDSYTVGEGVELSQSWPYLLRSELMKRGMESDLKIIAKTGWTTDELLTAIEKENLKRKFDYVFLLIGVNNQYRKYSLNNYENDFLILAEKAIHFSVSADHVIVLSIPDWGFTPYAEGKDRSLISQEIDAYNSINKNISIQKEMNYIYITDISRKTFEDPQLLAEDNLHPSGKMYIEWVKKILERIKL
jgi:lysophospholipase L1-like esterase